MKKKCSNEQDARALVYWLKGAFFFAHEAALALLREPRSTSPRVNRHATIRAAVKTLSLSADLAVVLVRLECAGYEIEWEKRGYPLPKIFETTTQAIPGQRRCGAPAWRAGAQTWRCGAPLGNANAVRSGRYTKEVRALFARLKVFEAQVRAALILAETEIAAGLALKELQRFGMDARVARRHHAPALGARLAAPVRHHAARRFDDRN